MIKLLIPMLVLISVPAFAEEKKTILEAARETMLSAHYCALITVDESGQPRARTVDPFDPESDFTVWMATRPVTRKVEQIRDNPKATLYYWDATTTSYVTLMGNAELITDDKVKAEKRRPGDNEQFYPNFPNDYLLIKFTPDYLEAIVPGYRGSNETWAPARAEFKR